MTTTRDPYKVLGVPITAEPLQIRQAFRSLALKHHPDVNPDPNSHSYFQELNEAYQTLSDPDRKLRYDQSRNQHRPPAPDSPDDILNSTQCPNCQRRKNPGFRTCYVCRPQEEICPECKGYKSPRFRRCYTCRFN